MIIYDMYIYIYLSIYVSMYLCIYVSMYLFIHSLIHSFIHAFIHSFNHSFFIYLFIIYVYIYLSNICLSYIYIHWVFTMCHLLPTFVMFKQDVPVHRLQLLTSWSVNIQKEFKYVHHLMDISYIIGNIIYHWKVMNISLDIYWIYNLLDI